MKCRTLKIGICDDDSMELGHLRGLVQEYGQLKSVDLDIQTFNNGDDLLKAVQAGVPFDGIFLDIYMGLSNGLSIAKKIRESENSCALIFATNSRSHAIEGYAVRALQYLLKPITSEALSVALDQVMENLGQSDSRWVQIKNRQGQYKILLKDIVYAESSARILTLHLDGLEPVSFYERLDNFDKLCDDPRFLRCHKSFLVNLDFVHSIVNNTINLENGKQIQFSMNPSKAKEIFASYMGGTI